MKKLVKIAVIAGVGYLVVKKVVDMRKAKVEDKFDEINNEEEIVDVEVENVKEEKIDEDECIVPPLKKEGKVVNDNIQGAAKFEGFEFIDKWLENYERKIINYLKENPNALVNIINGVIALLYGRKYGLKGFVGYCVFVRIFVKYGNEIVCMFQ